MCPQKLAAYIALIAFAAPISGTTPAQQADPAISPAAMSALQTGEAAQKAGEYDAAAKAFRKASKIEHDQCFRCSMDLAVASYQLGDLQGALDASSKSLSVASDDSERAAAHHFKGIVVASIPPAEKNLKAAEAELREAVQLDGKVAEYHLDLGIDLMKEMQDDDGKREVAAYLSLEPRGQFADAARKLMEHPDRAGFTVAPGFSIKTLQGDDISLDGLAGKFVVIDFWATWCPPCRDSVSDLKSLTKKYSHDQVVLISVSADDDAAQWRSFIAKKNMDWAQFLDSGGEMRQRFNVHEFPTYVVIDPQGFIRERIVGENPMQSVVFRLKDALAALTADEPKS